MNEDTYTTTHSVWILHAQLITGIIHSLLIHEYCPAVLMLEGETQLLL